MTRLEACDLQCNCDQLNADTLHRDDRVLVVADAAPECTCESQRMSPHSPGPVQSGETLARMVCFPMHVHRKRRELKPSFFDHAFSFGLSIQRLDQAKDEEIATLVEGFLTPKDDLLWLGYIEGSCEHLRSLRAGTSNKRLFCIYDTAEERNPAHAEIGVSHRIDEADQIEYRRELMRAFGDGLIHGPKELRDSAVWSLLPESLRVRPVPPQWLE